MLVRWVTPRVRWLGDVCSEPPPADLSSASLTAYAQKCGTEAALDYVAAATGVDVSGCTSAKTASDLPSCIASGYGVRLDVIDADGNVKWDAAARDAGAVGGAGVCIALGAGTSSSVCARFGSTVVGAIYDWAAANLVSHPIDCSAVSLFPASWPFDIGPASFHLADAFYAPPSDRVLSGVLLNGQPKSDSYVSRLAVLRSLSIATARLLSDFGHKAGVSPAQAMQIIKPAAPWGWSALLRPDVQPLSGTYKGDHVVSIGALLDSWWNVNAVTPDGHLPRKPAAYDTSAFWGGIDPTGARSAADLVYRAFQVRVTCPTFSTVWSYVGDQKAFNASVKGVFALSPSPAQRDQEQTFTYYWTPKNIDFALDPTTMSADTFAFLTGVWAASINRNMSQELSKAKSLPKGGGSSGGGAVFVLGLLGAAAYAYFSGAGGATRAATRR